MIQLSLASVNLRLSDSSFTFYYFRRNTCFRRFDSSGHKRSHHRFLQRARERLRRNTCFHDGRIYTVCQRQFSLGTFKAEKSLLSFQFLRFKILCSRVFCTYVAHSLIYSSLVVFMLCTIRYKRCPCSQPTLVQLVIILTVLGRRLTDASAFRVTCSDLVSCERRQLAGFCPQA